MHAMSNPRFCVARRRIKAKGKGGGRVAWSRKKNGTWVLKLQGTDLTHAANSNECFLTVRHMLTIMMKDFIYIGYVPLTDKDPAWVPEFPVPT